MRMMRARSARGRMLATSLAAVAVLGLALQAASASDRVVQVTAERYKFTPATIRLRVGEAVVLELTTLDRRHGFQVPDLKIDETIEPGKVTRVKIVPDKAGTYEFHCSVFCGSGHEEMSGELVVSP